MQTYIHVDRKAFKIARFICDAIQGTDDVNRPVEDKTLTREPKDIVFYNRESHTMIHVDREKLFWQDVKSVKAMLDKDGNYQGLSSAKEIADKIVMSGICWVSCKMIKYAQKQLRSTNCRNEIS